MPGPAHVDRHNRLRAFGDCLLRRRRIETERIVHLGDDGHGVAGDDRGGRGNERVGRNDHLVAGADSQRAIRADQRRRAGIDGQTVPHAGQVGQRLLGRLDLAWPRIVVAEQVRPLEIPVALDKLRDLLFVSGENCHRSNTSSNSSLPILLGNGPNWGTAFGAFAVFPAWPSQFSVFRLRFNLRVNVPFTIVGTLLLRSPENVRPSVFDLRYSCGDLQPSIAPGYRKPKQGSRNPVQHDVPDGLSEVLPGVKLNR